MSIAPFSIKNSLRWKPGGSFSRTVCSITRGPAKPIKALGSAILISPNIARLAETPPMVGSVSTEMYGKPRSCILAKAALVFAICISDINASCIRAPPLEEKHTNGQLSSSACSTARTKRAPTTDAIDPPIKANSNEAATIGMPCKVPFMATKASFSPVSFCAAEMRSLYFLESLNFRISFGSSSLPNSTSLPASSSICNRERAVIRMW